MTRIKTETTAAAPAVAAVVAKPEEKENKNETETENENDQGTSFFTLLLFAAASTYTGGKESLRLRGPTTLRGLLATLESRFPGFTDKVVRSAAITVNLEYVDFDPDSLPLLQQQTGVKKGEGDGEGDGDGLDLVIHPGDEVGILPPVSSG